MKRISKLLIALVLTCLATVCFYFGCDALSSKPTMPDYQNPQETYNVYNNVTIDGKVEEDEWSDVNSFESIELLNPYGNGYEEFDAVHYVEFATKYSDEGLLMYFKVFGAEPLINVAAHPFYNSGIELYLAPKDASVVNGVAWQIGLLYDGTYILTKNKQASLDGGFAYITHNGYIDIKGEKTVVEDNLEETGYVIETMFPWELLDFGDKPEWINVDVALQYKTDINSVGRDMWYSIGQNNKENYSLGTPTSWFKFDANGYCDEKAPIPFKVNNGEELSNGTVTVDGTIESGAVLEVVPSEGYVIKSLKVNGEVINASVYEIPANSAVKLDVEVEFILESEIVFSSINANIMLDKIGNISSVADGAIVKLSSFTFNYDVEVVDGKITVADVAPGLYDVIVDGYKVGKITVGEEEYVDDIVLEYNVFSSVSNPYAIDISKANDGEISMVGGGTAYFAEDDLVFASFDLVDSCTLDGQRSGLGIFMGKEGVTGYTNAVCLFYDGGYIRIRQMYVNWNTVTLGTYVPGEDVNVSLAMAVVDGTTYILYKYNSDAWKIAWTFTGDYGYIKALNSGSSNSVATNLFVSDTIPEITFDATIKDDLGNVITDGSLGTVSIENNGFGKQSVITIDAVNGYRINSVIINGENVTTALMGGVLNYTSVNVTNDVVVIFEEYGEYNATLTFNYAESNIFGASKAVDAGSVITIEGLGSYTIGNDGVLVIEKIYSGTYNYTVSGCDGNYSFTVGKENLVETAYLTRKVIASASNPAAVDLSNINNGTFTTTNACNLVLNETNAVFVSADTVDISTQGGSRSGFGIYLSKDRASWVSAMCVYIDNGAVKLRHMYSNWTTLDLGTAYNTGDEVNISLATAIYGGKVYYLYKYNTTEWQVAWVVTGDYGYIAMIGSGITSTVSNLVIREEVPADVVSALNVSSNVTIKDGEGNVITDGSIGTAVVNSGIVGENATVIVSAKEGYIIDTVLVNGQNVTAQLVDGVYTFVANTTNIDVEVKFAIGQFKATLTLTYADDYVYGEGGGYVEAGAIVTVVGKVGTYVVGENGTVVIDNLPAGSYSFTVNSCSNSGTFEIVDTDVTSSVSLLRKVIDSSSAPANADYSNANAGTITWTAGANLFLYNQNVKFVSAKYTGVAQSGNKNSSGFYIYMDRDQSGAWTQAYMLRYDDEVKPTLIQNKPWEALRLTSYYTAGTTYSVYLALALYEGYGYMLFKTDVNADWRIFKSFENVYGDILMIGAGLPTTASELKISETVPTDVANFLTTSSTLTIKDGEGNVVTDGSMGTATVNSSVIGKQASVAVSANEGYIIGSVIVNGADVTAQLVNGVYTFVPTTNAINVEVVFTVGQYKATLTLTYADDYAYGVGGDYVEAGAVVTVVGKVGTYVVGENGVVVIDNLPAGSYTFTVDTCSNSGTFEIVDADVETSASLLRKVFSSSSNEANTDYTDVNNGNFKFINGGTNLFFASDSIQFVTFKYIGSASYASTNAMGIYMDPTGGVYGQWTEHLVIRYDGSSTPMVLNLAWSPVQVVDKAECTINGNYEIYVALVLYQGKGYMLFKTPVDTAWSLYHTFTPAGDIYMINAGKAFSATEFRLGETVPQDFIDALTISSNVTVKDGEGNVITDEAMGTVAVNGSVIGASATVNVSAKEGYIIGSVIVNGADVTAQLVDGVYTFVPKTNAIDVEVVFTTGAYSATITLTYADDYVYGEGGGFVEAGAVVTVVGKAGSYVVGENGVVVIENLPAGSYTFTVNSCSNSGTFEIVDADVTSSVSLLRKVIDSSSVPANADYSNANAGTITWTAGANLFLYNQNVKFVSAKYTGVAQSNNKDSSGFYIYMDKDQSGAWTQAYMLRYDSEVKPTLIQNKPWESLRLTSYYTAGTTYSVYLAFALYEGYGYMLFKTDANADWRIFKSFENVYGDILMIGAGLPTTASELKISETVPTDVANFLTTSSTVTVKDSNGNVVTDGSIGTAVVESSVIGAPATITVTPVAGYSINSLSVNGTNVTASLADGTYTFNPTTNVINVEVVFSTGSYNATITVKYADDVIYGVGGVVEAGTVVTIDGKDGSYVVGENGLVVIEGLPAGSYSFSIPTSYHKGTFTIVDEDITTEVSLYKKVLTAGTVAGADVSDINNGNITWTAGANLYLESNNVMFVSADSVSIGANSKSGFYIYMQNNGAHTHAFVIGFVDGALKLRHLISGGGEVVLEQQYVSGTEVEVSIALAYVNGVAYSLYKYNGSDWKVAFVTAGNFASIKLLGAGVPTTVSKLLIKESVPQEFIDMLSTSYSVTVKDGEGEVVSDETMGTATVNSTVIGAPATVTVEKKADYIIGSVIVNGADVTAQLVNGVYTFVPTTNAINVEVVFTTGSYTATLTLTYGEDYAYGVGGDYVEAGSIVTVVGKAGSFVVGENGQVVIENLPAGSFTFTVDTCSNSGSFEVVDADVNLEVTLLRLVFSSSSVPANTDYTDANNGNFTFINGGTNLFFASDSIQFVTFKYIGSASYATTNAMGIYMDPTDGVYGQWTEYLAIRYDGASTPMVLNMAWSPVQVVDKAECTINGNYEIYVALVLYQGKGYMLFKTPVDTEWSLYHTFTPAGDIYMINAGKAFSATEFRLGETVPQDFVDIIETSYNVTVKDGEGNVVTDESLGTVAVSSGKIGESATITVTPKGDYLIANVTLNGTDITSQLVDGVYTFVAKTSAIDVEVTFAVGQYTATLTLKYSDDAVHGIGGYIEEGAILTIIGRTYSVGANGEVVIDELPAGSYAFTVDTCANEYTFEIVNEDISLECTLYKKVFVRSSAPANVDYSDASNGNVTWTNGANLYLANQDFVFVSARYSGGASSIATNSTTSGFYIYMSNDGGTTNTEGFVMQYTNPSSNASSSTGHEARLVRHTNWGVKSTLSSSYSINWILDVHLGVALYNGNVYFLFKWNNGDWRYMTHFENTFGNIHMIGCGKPASISELTLSYEVPADVMTLISAY